MPYTIRPADRSDLEACAALWRRLQDEHEALEPRLRRSDTAEKRWRNDFRVWVRSQAHAVYVGDGAGEVVGLVTAHPHWPAPVYEQRLEIYINELIVMPKWRGRGMGRALVEAVRAWAGAQGVERIQAGILNANAQALEFWRRIGAQGLYTTVTLGVEGISGER